MRSVIEFFLETIIALVDLIVLLLVVLLFNVAALITIPFVAIYGAVYWAVSRDD